MARYIVLLRGINLGSRNRIAMAPLREALGDAGFDDVRTYLQSGNVVLSSRASARNVASDCERVIAAQFELDISVVVRTRDELAQIVRRNPLRDVAVNHKRYQVSFLSSKPDRETVRKLMAAVVDPEQLVVVGREAYAWHPKGVARSRLWAQLAGRSLGVMATARNWTTVTALLALADE
ncbi:MAG TPA: DUF1697 domain-containing protein [Gaiellaceae bacterium]|nr:DUF1697 domain-containing protein [Gaiellaceae bacterium]